MLTRAYVLTKLSDLKDELQTIIDDGNSAVMLEDLRTGIEAFADKSMDLAEEIENAQDHEESESNEGPTPPKEAFAKTEDQTAPISSYGAATSVIPPETDPESAARGAAGSSSAQENATTEEEKADGN
jgi:hypothetical protein